MKFGVCTTCDASAAAQAAGWDYIEDSVQRLLQGQKPDEQWQGEQQARQSALPIAAANLLVPASLKITGPAVDAEALRHYMQRVLHRAKQVGMQVLVFGSGGARQIPEGFDRQQARRQILDFLRTSAPIAAQYGVTIVAEPLNRSECNILNSVAEAMEYVREVNHPNFQCLVDSYHFWLEEEPLEHLRQAMASIKHVHVADKDGRVAPGESGTADYRPFFAVLKQGGYNGRISVEASGFNVASDAGPRVLAYLKKQWNEA
jgi:sugar phosphate isomerase/epimerase